jgi:hypothetical protein
MRLATFNVENMFERVKVMNLENWADGQSVLEDFNRLNELIQLNHYSNTVKTELLEILNRYPALLTQQTSEFIRLRIIRGKLFSKPANQPAAIVASGRTDWIGWFELIKDDIKDTATINTGHIIDLLKADVLCLIEVENRMTLKHFNQDILSQLPISSYHHVMLIDGNDDRGIDVGIMTKKNFDISRISSHVDDEDDIGTIFSRDCAEYEITHHKAILY